MRASPPEGGSLSIEIHGYAIVSEDDRIAAATGETPAALRNKADWAYFQDELGRAALTVVGRVGHEANPNRQGRPRLILSSRSAGLESAADGWWWNPVLVPWEEAVGEILPRGGRAAVAGGQRVYDLFLHIGYDAFHLSRAHGTRVSGGVALFSDCDAGEAADAVLARHGLQAGETRVLDPAGPVTLTVWRRS